MKFNRGAAVSIVIIISIALSVSHWMRTQTSLKNKLNNNDAHISKLKDHQKSNVETNKVEVNIPQSVQPKLLESNKSSNSFDWSNVKKTLIAQQDIILYCTWIIILTTLLLVLFKSLKVIFHTNKYSEKDLFSARKLFKSKEADVPKAQSKPSSAEKIAKGFNKEQESSESSGYKYSWGTINEDYENELVSSNQRGTFTNEFNADGERVQGILRRNHLDRKTNEEPEILSAFSVDKSDDFAMMPRKYIKPNFDNKRDKRVEYYKEREKAIFGYDDNEDITAFKPKTKKPKRQEKGVKNLTLKFEFSDNESEQEGVFYEYFPEQKVQHPKKWNVTENIGRQTIDLNGPIYDPNLISKKDRDTLSELEKDGSEAEEVNNLLTQFGCKSFKGFVDSDLTNTRDEKLNFNILSTKAKKRTKK